MAKIPAFVSPDDVPFSFQHVDGVGDRLLAGADRSSQLVEALRALGERREDALLDRKSVV